MFSNNKSRAPRFIMIAVIGLAAIFLFGFVIQWLWNTLMPQIFNLQPIGYWQAIGLFILSRIFFGGFFKGDRNKGRCGNSSGADNCRNKWKDMTEEERARFKNEWRKRCG